MSASGRSNVTSPFRSRGAARRLFARPAQCLPLLALLLAGGCANVHHVEVGAIPDDYRTRHPIVVSEAETALDIPVVVSDGALSYANRGRVEDFADRFRASGADFIQVQLPSGSMNQYAADRVSHDIVKVLNGRRVARDRVFVQPYPAVGASGPTPIRLAFTTLVAKTGPCGRWPTDLAETSQNKNYHNFGCASQQNLAAQIADPRDLLSPRGVDTIDAERRTTVLDNYRRGVRTTSQAPETESDYEW
ncbi:pilus assembly protein CpaD [Aurantimonas aggregata]|uniref:Pilus assembly protein CpaD n=1 Tax=Aurantimonas aggregata TaxID=2047720 RepID=A0A6L9MF79_9HYPH|nr:CpaD family pilus assembly lipoprotein [Aurantimonas aggregata]NDV86250.1 pilus assembly protein CpaD [Aurantimonas aggregata]